jgi:hypothetical protein
MALPDAKHKWCYKGTYAAYKAIIEQLEKYWVLAIVHISTRSVPPQVCVCVNCWRERYIYRGVCVCVFVGVFVCACVCVVGVCIYITRSVPPQALTIMAHRLKRLSKLATRQVAGGTPQVRN